MFVCWTEKTCKQAESDLQLRKAEDVLGFRQDLRLGC